MYANYGVLYFAKRIIIGTHYCDINCPVVMKNFSSHYNMLWKLIVYTLKMWL